MEWSAGRVEWSAGVGQQQDVWSGVICAVVCLFVECVKS